MRSIVRVAERFGDDPLQRWFPLVMLAVAGAIGLLTSAPLGYGSGRVALLGAGVLLGGGWIAWYNTGSRRDSRHEVSYLVGRALLAGALSIINPLMAIFAWVGYVDAHDRLRRPWPAVVFALTAVSMAGAQSGGLPPDGAGQWALFGLLVVVNVAIAGVVTLVALRDSRVSAERATTIAALEKANARLEAALAENASLHEQLVTQAREAGIVEERHRLAREIHDTIAQGLAGIVTQLQAARETRDSDLADDHLDRAANLARESLEEARRSVRDLGPRALEDEDLTQALETLATSWATHHGVPVTYAVTGEQIRLHPELEATLLRVAQESLTNVGKHAGAGRVGVTLSFMDDEVALDVRDDGVGFTPEAAGRGFGLAGMRQRVARVAGLLEVETAPGQGVAVSVRLPSVRHA